MLCYTRLPLFTGASSGLISGRFPLVQEALLDADLLAARLYTGPMYAKLNAVLRWHAGLSLTLTLTLTLTPTLTLGLTLTPTPTPTPCCAGTQVCP